MCGREGTSELHGQGRARERVGADTGITCECKVCMLMRKQRSGGLVLVIAAEGPHALPTWMGESCSRNDCQ